MDEVELAALEDEATSLARENAVIESHLQHVAHDSSPHSPPRTSARASARARNPTLEAKLDVAAAEADHQLREASEHVRDHEKAVDELRAEMEAIDLQIAEIKKDAYEFKRDIVTGGENFRTGKTMAEKVTRYMEEKLHAKDAAIEKLDSKHSTLRTASAKLEKQLQHKEDMGDVLHVIDYDQLKIENQKYLEKIEERNRELLQLKVSTGRAIQTLNGMKQKLQALTSESEWLRKETNRGKESLGRILDEIARAEREHVDAKRVERRLQQKGAGADANLPQIFEYVTQKAEMHELERMEQSLRKKLEISRLEARRCRKLTMATRVGGLR